jgi:hypothetical protein
MSLLKSRLAKALQAPLPIQHQMRDKMLAEKRRRREEDFQKSRDFNLDYRTLRSRPK